MSLTLRNTNVGKLSAELYDVCIVGGGINGAVSAAALAAQGVSVALIDRGDFAGETSSQSSNLAWGGIKYMETLEFPLVWNLCDSRNHLSRSYPSTVQEIRFLTTIEKGFRFPPWFVYLGSLAYWVMGRFATRPPEYLSAKKLAEREARIRIDDARAGIEYSDCYLHDNDARFVFNFVRSAMDYGAVAANYVGATAAERVGDHWTVTANDEIYDTPVNIRARVLINACGPYVDGFNELAGITTKHRHVFSKGVHLMVDRITDDPRILAFFASDGRLFFVIPMGPKTCIGTTDTQVEDPRVGVTAEDRRFVLENANELLELERPLTEEDVIAERCGVRPLAVSGGDTTADWVALSRKHAIDADLERQHLSLFGGKLTDCINMGDEVADLVEEMGVARPYPGHRWYGEPNESVRQEFLHQARLVGLDDMADPRACEPLSLRLWRRYGRAAFDMLEEIREEPVNATRMMEHAEYLRCEIEQAGRREMITKLDDFLRRRSKISLVVPRELWIDSPGLREACRVLFGDEADAKLEEYLN